ncbi:MAG: carbamoyltransferase C-terminal domain-containing protein [Myxococcota bacterium]
MKVLGYNGALEGYPGKFGAGHDSAAAIVVDGELVAACEEERFNREKHSGRFPRHAIEFCLKEAGLKSLEEVDLIAYYWSYPLMFRQEMLTQNQGSMNVLEKLGTWTVLRTMQTFNKLAGYDNEKSRKAFERDAGITLREKQWAAVPHHLCHVGSTFYDSPFEEALCVTLDASGESSSSMVAVARGTKVETLHEVLVPNSLGFLYMFVTDYLGFTPGSDEYKVMGLAPYGDRSAYRDFFRTVVRRHDDGKYEVDQGLMVQMMATLDRSGVGVFPPALTGPLGKPRKEKDPIEQRHMDIAASLQECLEETVLHSLARLQKQTGMKNLCMAGGVALNSTMNGKIARSGLFDGVWIHPAAHDAGCSVGAALVGYHNLLKQPRHFQQKRHRYLGPAHDHTAVESALKEYDEKITHVRPADLSATVAQAIADGKVVGWYQGRMEWGPRALGNRSILADARRDDMKDIVNHAVKLREGFRPFAPACLAEKAQEWFDLKGLPDSPFMLFVVPVHEDKRTRIPAVTHVDGSARVQTVSKEDNPRFHGLISAFEKLTGVPVIMNTSFNIKGEPIVNTPADAIRCFLGTQIDMLVLHDVIVEKRPEVAAALAQERKKGDSGRVVDGRISAV